MEGEEVEGLLVSREGVGRELRYARNYDDRRKHGMICGVNVFGVSVCRSFHFPFFFLRIEIPRMRLFRHLDSGLECFFVTIPQSCLSQSEFLPCLKVFPVLVSRSST